MNKFTVEQVESYVKKVKVTYPLKDTVLSVLLDVASVWPHKNVTGEGLRCDQRDES